MIKYYKRIPESKVPEKYIHRLKIGDKVYYDDRIGIIENLSRVYNGKAMYDIVSEDDPEITCSVLVTKVKKIIDGGLI
jgi:hypothetical protein